MSNLTIILRGVVAVVLLIGSLLFKNERQLRKTAEKERDEANTEALSANQRVEFLKNIEEIKRERQEKDNSITVDRERPMGVWHDDEGNNG